jgi:hypothetical protein
MPPYFAIDPFFKDASIIKKMQSVMMLLRMEHPQADEYLDELIAVSDLQTTFSVLKEAFRYLSGGVPRAGAPQREDEERLARLVASARRRHGEIVSLFTPAYAEMQRKTRLIERRRFVTGREHRFFLALLLNVPYRRHILQLVAQRFPQADPIDTVVRWVQELSAVKASQASAPGGNGGGFSPVQLRVLRRLLEGLSVEEAKAELAAGRTDEDGRRLRGEADALYDFLQSSILKSLLFEPEAAGGVRAPHEHQAVS